MEALKNTTMMLILAAVFYGAYQMFVSDPSSWKKDGAEQAQVVYSGGEGALGPDSGSLPMQADPLGQRSNLPSAQIQPLGSSAGSQTPLASETRNGIPPAAWNTPSPLERQQLPGLAESNGNRSLGINTPALPNSGTNPVAFPSTAPASGPGADDPGIRLAADPERMAPAVGPDALPPIQRSQSRYGDEVLRSGTRESMNHGVRQVGHDEGVSSLPPQSTVADPQVSLLAQDLHTARQEAQQGRPASALSRLSAWCEKPLPEMERQVLQKALDILMKEVVYSTSHHLAAPHVIQQGETLDSIAQKYGLTPTLLALINFQGQQVAGNTPLQPGASLKVMQGPFRAVANMRTQQLTIYLGNLYAGRFPFRSGDSQPNENFVGQISYASQQGMPASSLGIPQERIAPLAQGNPYGRYCLVVGNEFVMHSPGQERQAGCLEFSEPHMQQLQAILGMGAQVQVTQ